jgi:DNA ligase D-like protein (predicted ligase)/DNA ligase D-like protein (predicted 3'-phosphoesterase)
MKQYKPMLARTAKAPFSSKDWIFEVKWDGIRAISYITHEELSIKSRNQKELKNNFPELQELKELAANVVLDGEIIIIRDGKIDFQSLIKRIQATSPRENEHLSHKFPAIYVVFDLLEKDGESLIDKPLQERKKILEENVKEGKNVVISVFVEEDGEVFYKATLEKGLEGVIAKKKGSAYEPGRRSGSWLKIKKTKDCDCVIFGYTKGKGSRKTTFGALILGLYNGDTPIFVGKVGTGFNQKNLEKLSQTFKEFIADEITLNGADVPGEVTWLKPALVCNVGYQVVTEDGKLRMPRFLGMRSDKKPGECTLEQIRPKILQEYSAKRDFSKTPEPRGAKKEGVGKTFVVQEHDARRLHYDLRLEREGVLKSWAVPKGIPEEAGVKRLAVQTEDHPLNYGGFEGEIPKGQYGAGNVKIWDRGVYVDKLWEGDKIEFVIQGERLSGRYVLVKLKRGGGKNWLLLKARD